MDIAEASRVPQGAPSTPRALATEFELANVSEASRKLVIMSNSLAETFIEAEAEVDKALKAGANSQTLDQLRMIANVWGSTFAATAESLREHTLLLSEYVKSVDPAMNLLADLDKRVSTIQGQKATLSPGQKRRKIVDLAKPNPYLPEYDFHRRFERARSQLEPRVQHDPDSGARLGLRVLNFYAIYCIWKYPQGVPPSFGAFEFEAFCKELRQYLPAEKRTPYNEACRQAIAGITWTPGVLGSILLKLYQVDVEQVKRGQRSLLHGWSIRVQKDYAANLPVFINHIATFTELAWTRSFFRFMVEDMPEPEFVNHFVEAIKPDHCDLRIALKEACQPAGHLKIADAVAKFRKLLEINPHMRVSFPYSMPPMVRKWAQPVKYKLIQNLPLRPGQAEVESDGAELFCEVCYALFHEGIPRVSYRSHNVEYCVFVLGQWDQWNPACNPGPEIAEKPEYFHAIEAHHKRRESETSQTSSVGFKPRRVVQVGEPGKIRGVGHSGRKQEKSQQRYSKPNKPSPKRRPAKKDQPGPSSGSAPSWKGEPYQRRPLE